MNMRLILRKFAAFGLYSLYLDDQQPLQFTGKVPQFAIISFKLKFTKTILLLCEEIL